MLKNLNKTQLAKNAVGIAVQLGTGTVVGSIVSNNTPSYEDRTRVQRVTIPVAGFALGGLVAEKTRAYTDALIDQTVTALKDAVNRETKDDTTAL